MALFVMVVLVTLAGAAAAAVRLRLRAARAGAAAVQGLYLARAGLRLAEATLKADENAGYDALDEEWATLGNFGSDTFALGPGWFRVQIVDTASRVNLNAATKEMLMRLPGVDDAISDAILDWRDSEATPRPAGAKADYYQALPEPYLPREAALETVGELLLVRDVTPSLLYGPPQASGEGDEPNDDLPLSEKVTVLSQERNVSAAGQARQNLNELSADTLVTLAGNSLTPADAAAIVEYRQRQGAFVSVGDLFAVPGIGTEQVRVLADVVSTGTAAMAPGRVNVNTASEDVLAMVPGMTPEIAAEIVAAREGTHGPFESIGELLEPGMLTPEAFRQAAGYLCARSAAFLVRAMGRVPESPVVTAIEVLVERNGEGTRIVRWTQVDRAPGWIAWGWPRRTTDTETGGEIAW